MKGQCEVVVVDVEVEVEVKPPMPVLDDLNTCHFGPNSIK